MTWTQTPLKHLVEMHSGGTPDSNNPEYWTDTADGVPWVAIGAMSGRAQVSATVRHISQAGLRESRLIPKPAGTLLLAMYASVGELSELAVSATWNQALLGLQPRRGVSPRFVKYALLSLRPTLAQFFRSNTQNNLNAGQVGNLQIRHPDLVMQTKIARYLDRETARIDELISQQEDLVAAMALRRDAAVRAAVWAKASWRRVRNKNVLFETQDLSPSGNEELLSVSHITGVGARADMDVNMIEALSTIGYKVVRPDDLVINTLWGWMGALGVSQLHGIVSPAYGTYRAIDPSSVDMRFFGYLYRSSGYVGLIGANSRGVWSSRLRIYPETFLAMPVDIPPLAEQTKIADELDAITTHLDLLSQECRELIALLKERRSALVTAAVTGQIDVRSEVDTPDAEPTDRINSAR